MTNRIIAIVLISFFVTMGSLYARGNKEENNKDIKSIEEIQKEQGIPVKCKIILTQDFSTLLSFTTSLKGQTDSVGKSMISDTVKDVLVEVGDYVEKDQVIVTFPLNTPSANYYQGKAAYDSAFSAFKRVSNLFDNNGISRQDYDNAKTQYDVQKANWDTINNMVEVKAPVAGYVTRLSVQPSDNVTPGDTLFSVADYDYLSATVWASDSEISQIKRDQRVFLRWEGNLLKGKVTRVDLAKNPEEKAFSVKVLVANLEHKVPSGVTAEVNIETKFYNNSVVLNRKEMLKDGNEWYVYLNSNNHAKKQPIQIAERQGLTYRISDGLNNGDLMIYEGQQLLRDNDKILPVIQ